MGIRRPRRSRVGYGEKTDAIDAALGDFALAYPAQNKRDDALLVEAVNEGRIEGLIEED